MLARCVLAQRRVVQSCVSAMARCVLAQRRVCKIVLVRWPDGVSATARLSERVVAQTQKALSRHHTHAVQLSRNLREHIQEMRNHYLNII